MSVAHSNFVYFFLDNLAFIPNNVGIGLSVTDGENVYSLKESKYRTSDKSDSRSFDNFTLSSVQLDNLPDYSDIIPINVNRNTNIEKTFIAVPVEEQTQIRGELDFIKVRLQ